MSTEYRPLSRSSFTAEDFARNEEEFDTSREQSLRAEATQASAEEQPMFVGAPIYARTAKKKTANRSLTPMLMVGVPAVALLAGVAYFAMQPRQSIMTDPVPATAAIEAQVTNTAPPVEVATARTPPPVVAPEPVAVAAKPAARTASPTRVAAARPAPTAEAASSVASDASATSPAAPIPYSALSQTPAPAPAAIIVPPMVATPSEATATPTEPAPVVEEPATTTPMETPATATP